MTLGVILFKSIGAGYTALNMAGRNPGLEILEFSPLGDSAQLLIQGDLKLVSSFIVELRTGDIERSVCLPNFDEKVLRSYLSLENAKLQDFVLVVESHFSGDLFIAASELKALGMETVDFRLFRSQGSPCFLSMTGKNLAKVQDWVDAQRSKVTAHPLEINLLCELSPGFRQFVDFDS